MYSTTTSVKASPSIEIGDSNLSEAVMIVAEIGNNHEGDIAIAKEMIAAAVESGVDAVKFQTIEPTQLVSSDQKDRIKQLSRFKLSRSDFELLAETATNAGIHFLSTPFYLEAVEWLEPLVPAFKIASGDCNYTRLLETVARTGKPILLSTGASTLEEVLSAQQTISDIHKGMGLEPNLVLLHCVVSYPTTEDNANLSSLVDLSRLGTTIGYSDHTVGFEAAVLSVAMGARLIEKHFTLDKGYSNFRDHALSADPDEMAALVQGVRRAETIIGTKGKCVLPCESDARSAVRRSVHASCNLDEGTVLTDRDTICLRPETGLSPAAEAGAIGRKLKRNILSGAPILDADLN